MLAVKLTKSHKFQTPIQIRWFVYTAQGATPSAPLKLKYTSSIRSGQFYKQKECVVYVHSPLMRCRFPQRQRQRVGRLSRCLKREIETTVNDSLTTVGQDKVAILLYTSS